MKKITAIVRAEKLEVLKDALFAADVRGMTINQVQGCGAQHGAACADIFGSVKNHICLGTGEQLDRVQHRIQLAASQRGEQAADLPLDDGQCAGWRGQQSQTGFHRLRFLSGLCQLAQQRTCAVLQHFCRQ